MFRPGNIPWNKGTKGKQVAWNKGRVFLAREKNPNWKGGITSLTDQIRRSLKYKKWRSRVYERDNWQCVIGGKSHGFKLNVDHFPKQFAKIIVENNIKTLDDALSCKKLWRLSNGRTLCENCHRETDTYLRSIERYVPGVTKW